MTDFPDAETTYSVVAAAMEKWIETNYDPDFFPDGRLGARAVVQAMLDLGWQHPEVLSGHDVQLSVRDNGGPGNGIVARVDKEHAFFPLPRREQEVSVAEIRKAFE